MSNQPVDPLSLLSFGTNDLALLHLLPDTDPHGRPTGEGLRSHLRRDRRRHTAWSQRERAHDITGIGFQFRLDSRVLPSLESNEEEQRRTRRPQSPGLLT